MKRIYRLAKPVSLVLAFYVFMVSGPQQAALAALVDTETVMDAARVQNARGTIHNLLAREDIQKALVDRGIDPQEARARASALSDAEAIRLADTIESSGRWLKRAGDRHRCHPNYFHHPAHHRILGLTNIFPFVRHGGR